MKEWVLVKWSGSPTALNTLEPLPHLGVHPQRMASYLCQQPACHAAPSPGCVGTYDLNKRGDATFAASLDTDGDEVIDATGVYVWSKGDVQLVAQTGTEIPGIGTVDQILPPDVVGDFPEFFSSPWFGEDINDRGQVLFPAALEDGSGAMLVATPSH